ncbi:MAG TPA: MBOAT family O-acyltransferase [Xanthobacteraceae bacterium]|nr:MBOAT family O-acyltransferase [Xanthobacteraceae bacterium]
MVFSSNIFIFGFIPIFFSLYFLSPFRFKNGLILIFSLLFYAYGAGPIAVVLVLSIVVNYAGALALARADGSAKRWMFIALLALNIGALAYYKYFGFLWDIADELTLGYLSSVGATRPNVLLPIGISFFTFQALSYVADVYTGHCRPCPKLVDFGMYHAMFPQLIAGPIVRYTEIESQVTRRTVSAEWVAEGAMRFIVGLAKKVIIADNAGVVADAIFGLDGSQLTASVAWLGAIAYAVQILFDFAGYSDMAIGMAKAMGFVYPENFNHPYQSTSIIEFWHRWHMTLSRFFMSYVYNPILVRAVRRRAARGLPVSQKALADPIPFLTLLAWPTLFTMALVGVWHGAAWKFVFFGVLNGCYLVANHVWRIMHVKLGWKHEKSTLPGRLISWALTFAAVLAGFIVFRSPDLASAAHFIATMAGLIEPATAEFVPINFLPNNRLTFLIVGLVIALLPLQWAKDLFVRLPGSFLVARAAALAVFVYSALLMAEGTFNPFIYFRF